MFKKTNIIFVIMFMLFCYGMALGCVPLPVALLTADSNHVAVNVDITFDGSGSSDPDGYITLYEWDFSYDGSTFNSEYSETSAVGDGIKTYSYPNPGVYTVALRVTDNDNPAKYDYDMVTVAVGMVKRISGTQEIFYSTISGAIDDAATTGDEIVVYPGTFEESITVNKNITLRSQYYTDWENVTKTIIESASTSSPAIEVTAAGSGSEISGFTVKNGKRGIYCLGTSESVKTSLTLSNLIITNNDTASDTDNGGGIYLKYADADIENTYITENEAGNGGGIYSKDSVLNMANCVLWKNATRAGGSGLGGGLYFEDSDLSLDNCTFSKNIARYYGGAVCSYYFFIFNTVTVNNCIFWNNEAGTSGDDIYNNGSSNMSLTRCIIDSSYTTGSNLLPNSPNFKDEDNLFGSDMIPGSWDDGLRPLPETQAIDAAYKVTSTPTNDIAGSPRVDNLCANTGSGTPGYIDIGAYEVPRIFFVDSAATGSNNGNTWDDAYKYLRDALGDNRLASGDWLFVSAGTYYPDADLTNPNGDDDVTKSFNMVDGVYIFGGFSESAGVHSRDWNAGVVCASSTILDGNLGSGYSYNIVNGADGTRLDGFTINHSYNQRGLGGGLMVMDDSMIIANCIFKNNYSIANGGAVYALSYNCENTVTFENCVFSNNTAGISYDGEGGAISNSEVKAIFSNCIFNDNQATNGGAIANFDSFVEVSNCTFYDNIVDDDATGIADVIYNIDYSNLMVYNSIIWNDTTDGCEGIIYNETGSSCSFGHCVVQDCGGSASWDSGYGQDMGNNYDFEPDFAYASTPAGIDGIWGTSDDGLMPDNSQQDSLVDIGLNSEVLSQADLRGRTRVLNTTVDIGAYEFDLPTPATSPSPSDEAETVSTTPTLQWTAGTNAVEFDLYYGTSASLGSSDLKSWGMTTTSYTVTTALSYNTMYYWKVVSYNKDGDEQVSTPSVWSFTTEYAPAGQASSPSPSSGTNVNGFPQTLTWTAGSGATKHRVYFGTSAANLTFRAEITTNSYATSTLNLAAGTTYYWRVDEVNANNQITTGEVWNFSTISDASAPAQPIFSWTSTYTQVGYWPYYVWFDTLISTVITDNRGTVQYFFEEGNSSDESGWITNNSYTDPSPIYPANTWRVWRVRVRVAFPGGGYSASTTNSNGLERDDHYLLINVRQ